MNFAAALALESILPVLVPVVMIGMFALIIRAAVMQTRKAQANLKALADRLGLTVQEPVKKGIFASSQSRVVGTFRNRPVQIYTYSTGSGKNRTTWCALSLQASVPAEFSLKVSGENLFTKAGRMLGIDDVATGDPAFDEKLYVKSKQPDFVRAALIPEIRMRMVDAWQKHRALGAFTVERGEVKYAEMGNFANAKICDRFPDMLEIAGDLAEIAETFRA